MALKVSNKNRKKIIIEPIIISEPTIIESLDAFSSSEWIKPQLFEQKVFTQEKKPRSFLQCLINSFTF